MSKKILRQFKLKKPYFIAEIGVNHEGSLKNAKMIDAAKDGGASAVKFQTYKAEKLAIKTHHIIGILKKRKQKANLSYFLSMTSLIKTL